MTTLSPERWQQVRAVLDAALELPLDRRERYVANACRDDETLRMQVEQLLDAAGRADDFLTGTAAEMALPLIPGDASHKTLAAGDRVGPYRIVREAGQGGMGTVYLAERDDQYRKRVALKVIRFGMDTADTHRRFVAERQILANMEHPGIARLLDGGVTPDGRPYFVMDYVDGVAIDRSCDERTLGVDERLVLFAHVCEAVAHAHRQLIVHRDLKPSNILVTGDGQVRLLDFGIAKLLTAESRDAARTAIRALTPEYASPEQLEGEPVSTASDVYSLGVILYRLMCGRSPYKVVGRAPQDVLREVLQARPEPPSAAVFRAEHSLEGRVPDAVEVATARGMTAQRLRRRLEGDIDAITVKALEGSPARRYESAQGLLEDVRNHLEGRPVSARPRTATYRLRSLVGRHREVVVAVLVAAAAFVAGVLYAKLAG